MKTAERIQTTPQNNRNKACEYEKECPGSCKGCPGDFKGAIMQLYKRIDLLCN